MGKLYKLRFGIGPDAFFAFFGVALSKGIRVKPERLAGEQFVCFSHQKIFPVITLTTIPHRQ